jgi:hypothetical protein
VGGTIRWILTALAALAVCAAAAAAESSSPAAWTPRDPVVADVVRMSAGGVSEPAMVEWLRRTRPAVAPLSADDLIGLSQAKVPQGVISELIALAAAPGEAPPAPVAPVPDAASPAAAAGPIPVRWTITYRAASEADLDEIPPDLALYLDGQLLARIPGSKADDRRGTIAFTRPLPPGTVSIRALLERHETRDGAWRYETRVVAEPIVLEITPGSRLAVTIEYLEDWLGLPRPPLAWSVARDDEVVAARERQGGDPRRWPWLCEDVEAGVGPRGPDSVQRVRLAECVRWASLWGGTAGIPARDQVRREAEAQQFAEFPQK